MLILATTAVLAATNIDDIASMLFRSLKIEGSMGAGIERLWKAVQAPAGSDQVTDDIPEMPRYLPGAKQVVTTVRALRKCDKWGFCDIGSDRAGFSEYGTPEQTCLTLPLPGIRS